MCGLCLKRPNCIFGRISGRFVNKISDRLNLYLTGFSGQTDIRCISLIAILGGYGSDQVMPPMFDERGRKVGINNFFLLT